MTDKPTPTDAELKAMWQLHAADIGGIFDFVRDVLAKWGTPQPVAREPLSEQDVLGGLMATTNSVLENCADAFEAGVRFAERAHGIPQKGGSNAE